VLLTGWCLVYDLTLHLFIYRNGQVRFHKSKAKGNKDGGLYFGAFPQKKDRDQIQAICRLAYDNKTLLCPGIPEAENDDEAFEAAQRFGNFVNRAKQGKASRRPRFC